MTKIRDRKHGLYTGAAGVYNLPSVEKALGDRKFDVYSTFISFDSEVDKRRSEFVSAAQDGRDILVAWQPSKTIGMNVADVLNSRYDAHIISWLDFFADLKVNYGIRVIVRFGHEMNSQSSHWSPFYTGVGKTVMPDPSYFVRLWWYVRDLDTHHDCLWFFCANGGDSPYQNGNHIEEYWPGENYVDIVGYDNYNSLVNRWLTPLETLNGTSSTSRPTMYSRVTTLHGLAEVWLGEYGCQDMADSKDTTNPDVYTRGGSTKAKWFEALMELDDLPRLTTLCYFSSNGTRSTWPIDSSYDSLGGWYDSFNRPIDIATQNLYRALADFVKEAGRV